MFIINVFFCVLWFLVIPILMGSLCINKLHNQKNNVLLMYVVGFLSMLSVFEILAVPMTFIDLELSYLIAIWSIIIISLSSYSVVRYRKNIKQGFIDIFLFIKNMPGLFVVFIILLIFQISISVFMEIGQANYTIDDAWYIGIATTSVDTNTIMRYNAYTGNAYNILNMRYVLAPLPIYNAVLSTLTFLRPLVLTRTVQPIFYISMSYIVYILIAKKIWKENRDKACVFLIFISILNIFSNYTIYTPGTFLLIRIWQGKALLSNIMIPFLFYLIIEILNLKNIKKNHYWFLIILTMIASVTITSMGVFLTPAVLILSMIVVFIKRRDFAIIKNTMICLIPNLICGFLYLIMKYLFK